MLARRQRADARRPRDARRGDRAPRASASAPTAAGTTATPPSTTSTCAATRRRPRSRSSRSSGGRRRSSTPGIGFLRESWRREPGGLTTAQAVVAFRLHGVEDEVASRRSQRSDRSPGGRRSAATRLPWRGRCSRAGPDALLEPLEVARMSLTRRQLVIRSGAVAAWAAAGGVALADRMGAFDEPPPFDRAAFPEPGPLGRRRAPGRELRRRPRGAGVSTALRLVEADVRGRSVLLKPNLVEFFHGSVGQHRPAARRRGGERDAAARRPFRRRRGGPGPSAGHGGRRRRRRGCGRRSTTRGLRVRRPERRAGRPHAAPDRYTGLRELWVPTVLRDDGRRRLDAEAQDAPLGRA